MKKSTKLVALGAALILSGILVTTVSLSRVKYLLRDQQ